MPDRTTLRALIVEDCEDDAYLIERQLRQHGFEPHCRRVQTVEDMRQALEQQPWDIIISDYLMPRFNAFGALKLAREMAPDVPFIVVSGSIGEDVAVEAMRNGVQDYIMKDNMSRLSVAVQRELREAVARRERMRNSEEVSERLRDAVCRIRQSSDLDEAHNQAEDALRLIDELSVRARSAKAH